MTCKRYYPPEKLQQFLNQFDSSEKTTLGFSIGFALISICLGVVDQPANNANPNIATINVFIGFSFSMHRIVCQGQSLDLQFSNIHCLFH